MFESCPRKRMVLLISLLTFTTILVLIIESRWVTPKQKVFRLEHNSTCYTKEEYEIILDCHPCLPFEIASQSQGVCIHTHFKEVLRCKSGETVIRSCDKVAWLDERNFWSFSVSLFVVGGISTALSTYRQRVLDRRTMLKVQRQLGQTV